MGKLNERRRSSYQIATAAGLNFLQPSADN
jgi:hypothetical protein